MPSLPALLVARLVHLAINLAFKACRNGEEIKAISQNFGHEHIATTMSVYGNYPPSRLTQILKDMEFSGKQRPTIKDEILEAVETALKRAGGGKNV